LTDSKKWYPNSRKNERLGSSKQNFCPFSLKKRRMSMKRQSKSYRRRCPSWTRRYTFPEGAMMLWTEASIWACRWMTTTPNKTRS
jgi:hypothetical protein